MMPLDMATRVGRFTHRGVNFLVIHYPSVSSPAGTVSRLTGAEAEVLRLLVDGRSLRAIADARQVSARTVANQVQSIYRKHGVNTREELVAKVSQCK